MKTPLPPRIEDVAERLRQELGPETVLTDPDRTAGYQTDAFTLVEGSTPLVLRPADPEAVVAAIHTLSDAGVPFVPQGARSGLAGAAIPREAAVISTERMDRIVDLNPGERTATVEPGVVTADISAAAADHGLRYLPDPASDTFCTIGGNVAANAGGAHCLRHGVTTDHVLRLDVVTPEGQRVTLDRGESGGLDLAGLFIGSEGLLGIAVGITVRLVPRPPAVTTALALFDSLEEAGEAVTEILAAGLVPVAVELVDQAAIRAVEDSPHAAGLPTDVAAALLVECEGFAEEADDRFLVAGEALQEAGARDVLAATDEAQRKKLWRARREAYHALEPLAPDILIQDANVPRSELPRILPEIQEIARRHDLRVVNFFHAGDGNLHPNFVFDGSNPDEAERVEEATREIVRLCTEAGGTITGEHGVGLDKREQMTLVVGPAEMELQRALKAALDPRDLSNPGKVFPDVARR